MMTQWAPITLGLVAAVAALCLQAAARRTLMRRRAVHRRMKAFLVQPSALDDAGELSSSPTPVEHVLAVLSASSGIVLLMAAGASGALVSLVVGWTLGLVLAIATLGLGGVLALRRVSRRDQMDQQLVSALELMASAMESGYSIQQALERVVRDAPDPIASQFARVSRAIELGTPLEAALIHLAERVGGENFEFFATITAMQHRIGGDLPTLLTSLATRIRERLALKAEMQALTAQARYSGWVLIALPFAVVGLLLVANPGYLAPLIWSSAGRNMVLFAATLLVAGLATIRAISRVEV